MMRFKLESLETCDWKQQDFVDCFLQVVIENFALRKINDFDNIPIQNLCQYLLQNQKYLFNMKRWVFTKSYQLIDLVIICTKAIIEIKNKYSIEELIRNFYFDSLRDGLDMETDYFESQDDENGLPMKTPIQIREYISSLFNLFHDIAETNPEREFVKNLPTELETTIRNSVKWRHIKTLKNIIVGSTHKGVNLFGFFFHRIPENKLITQSLLIPKSFLRLCYFEWKKLILLEDDIESLDFKLAIMDLITFIDKENKLLFDNKIMQFRHNYAAQIIETALLAEIDKRYGS